MKKMEDATLEEWNEIKWILTLTSRQGGGDVTDRIEKIYNTFIANTKICRTCPTQMASIISIIKLRHDLNFNLLESKYNN